MKLFFSILILLASFITAQARPVEGSRSSQELFDKADLVVIARPVSTKDTSERRDLPGMDHVPVIGVETELNISMVLKGDKATKKFVLHHYRWNPPKTESMIINGPALVSFDPKDEYNDDYLLFLVRESDGRYAPAAGQVDPALTSVQELWNANHWRDVKAWGEGQRAKTK